MIKEEQGQNPNLLIHGGVFWENCLFLQNELNHIRRVHVLVQRLSEGYVEWSL